MALLLTPFDQNRSIDWGVYAEYVDWQVAHGPQGLFALCGTSEMKWLTLEERLRLAKEAVDRAKGKPVLATANLDLDLTKHPDEIRRMCDTGVAAVVLVPPTGLGRNQDRLEAYFASVAGAATCPVFLYEWPQVEAYFIDAEAYGRLATSGAIMGIKDTTCTVAGITAKINAAPDAIVYQANTPYLPEALQAGARGIMAITSSACADLVSRYWHAAAKQAGVGQDSTGDPTQAARLHNQLVYLDAILRIAHPLLAKHLVGLRGFDFPTECRWPVSAPPEVFQALSVWAKSELA